MSHVSGTNILCIICTTYMLACVAYAQTDSGTVMAWVQTDVRHDRQNLSNDRNTSRNCWEPVVRTDWVVARLCAPNLNPAYDRIVFLMIYKGFRDRGRSWGRLEQQLYVTPMNDFQSRATFLQNWQPTQYSDKCNKPRASDIMRPPGHRFVWMQP